MAFVAERLLSCVAMGVSGGPEFQTDVITVRSGHESRNRLWDQARRSWEIGMVARPKSEFEAIQTAFMRVGGRLDGFLWEDPFDSEVELSDGTLIPLLAGVQVGTAGVGYGIATYQLGKLYSTYLRDIRKPNVYTIRRAGVTQTVTTQFTIDTATGIVTFVFDQSKTISSQTPGATHVFTLASAFSPNLAIGGRIYVDGISGTAASMLNGLSHEITNVSSAVITTNTVTTGLTASGGTAYFFPQPSQTLDWTGSFNTPVRFDTDQFKGVVINRQGAAGELLIELPSIPLIEIRV